MTTRRTVTLMGGEALSAFALTLPVTKVDKDKRLVTGVATDETLDKQGEITDYDTAKALFTNAEAWPGNIREMHQPKAVGKAVEVECDDATRTITVTAKVSKGAPDTWEKVVDGTLCMFSIGGAGVRKAETRNGTPCKRLFLKNLSEVSLVDNGANPSAKFDIVKSVDGVQSDVALDDEGAIAGTLTPAPVVAAADALTAAVTATAAIKGYVGPDGTSFPVSTPDDVRTIAKAIGGARGLPRLVLKANLIGLAVTAGAEYAAALPAPWRPDATPTVQKSGMEPWDINAILNLIMGVESLLANEMWEARCAAADGGDAAPEVAQVQMLKAACDLLLEFLMSEYDEQFTVPAADATGATAAPGWPFADLESETAELFMKSLVVIQKAGARHSKGDQKMVQQVHDLAGDLGADCEKFMASKAVKAASCATCKGVGKIKENTTTCPDCKGEGTSQEENDVDKVELTRKLDEQSTTITKLETALAAAQTDLTSHQSAVAKANETVTAMEARLAKLEAQPLPGGPARSAHAVTKTVGAEVDNTDVSHDAVIKVFDSMAGAAKTDAERQLAASGKLRYMTEQGLNRVNGITGRVDESAS